MSGNKYRNRKVELDGFTFDSKKEARRYQELKLLENAGQISRLELQKKYILIPAQYETYERYSEKTGKRLKDGKICIEKECAYIADFAYIENGRLVVEDTKGMKTKDYIIKRKMLLFLYGIRVREV